MTLKVCAPPRPYAALLAWCGTCIAEPQGPFSGVTPPCMRPGGRAPMPVPARVYESHVAPFAMWIPLEAGLAFKAWGLMPAYHPVVACNVRVTPRGVPAGGMEGTPGPLAVSSPSM